MKKVKLKINKYYYPYHWGLLGFHKYKYEYVISIIKKYLRKNYSVLDIGCGDARRTTLLAQYVRKVIGIDNQQLPIDFARLILKNNKTRNVELYCKNSLNNNQVYDVITMFDVIEHIQPEKLVQQIKIIKRHMHKGSLLIITTPNRRSLTNIVCGHKLDYKHYQEFTPGQLKEFLNAYGFKLLSTYGIYLPLIPIRGIEHFANTFPFRSFFTALIRIGKYFPKISDTIVLVLKKVQ